MTEAGASRFFFNLGYRAAGVDWTRCVAVAAPRHRPAHPRGGSNGLNARQLAAIGFPPPGHAYWDAETLAATSGPLPQPRPHGVPMLINGLELNVVDEGRATFRSCSSTASPAAPCDWDDVAPAFAKSAASIRYDHRGHAESANTGRRGQLHVRHVGRRPRRAGRRTRRRPDRLARSLDGRRHRDALRA